MPALGWLLNLDFAGGTAVTGVDAIGLGQWELTADRGHWELSGQDRGHWELTEDRGHWELLGE